MSAKIALLMDQITKRDELVKQQLVQLASLDASNKELAASNAELQGKVESARAEAEEYKEKAQELHTVLEQCERHFGDIEASH